MEHLSPNQRAWRRFRQNRPAAIGGVFLAVMIAIILVWPILSSQAPDRTSDAQFNPPGAQYWCGTDVHGRDLLSRMCAGARISLLVGLVGAGVSLVIGALWGATAGYLGGRWDSIMMRFVDILYSLPSIIFVIVLITTLDTFCKKWLGAVFQSAPSRMIENWIQHFAGRDFRFDAGMATQFLFLFVGLGAVSWLTMARIVRGQVLSLRNRNFVDASRALGASHAHILIRHILPNVAGIIIVYLTLTIPSIILYESFLSYLGMGIQPPQASLGSLIADGAQQINTVRIYWWLIAFPGGVLISILLALNFFGDGLRDAFDPRADR
jgi:peptide/nickel transport system permease protein/oligopeptide transport system permease protein